MSSLLVGVSSHAYFPLFQVAVCNLASIALPRFVKADKTFDFQKLFDVTKVRRLSTSTCSINLSGFSCVRKVVTRNLDKIIDINYYPVPEAKVSNMRHRPIGIGVQGLADAFILMRFPFESEEAQLLNKQIFETIYYAALTSSCEIAKGKGPYQTYEGSPVSKGVSLWNMLALLEGGEERESNADLLL